MDAVVETLAGDRIRAQVQAIYGEAASVRKGLCCPKDMPRDMVDHIPPAAFDHSYGCGSPITAANISPGQIVADLGCGVGIDCFAAARLVGPTGRVIGVDMSNDMLSRAYAFNTEVAKNLGYDVVGFRKGTIDEIPLEGGSVDLIVSNCVVNLATDKKKVFKDVFRALRHGGRFVISDVISDRDIRPEDKADPAEWAECTVSTLSLRAFLDAVTEAGFIGLVQLAEESYTVKGYHLSSITLEARKFETDCHAGVSHLAIYLGPYAEVKDDLGNAFPRFKPVAVRDDVATFLEKSSNAKSFIVVAGRAAKAAAASQPVAAERRESPCCDSTDKVEKCCDNNEAKADGSPVAILRFAAGARLWLQPRDIGASCIPAAVAAASACCDSGSSGGGCGPGGCGPSASTAPSVAAKAATIPLAPVRAASAVAASACCNGGSCGTPAAVAPAGTLAAAPVFKPAVTLAPASAPVKAAASACCDSGSSGGSGPGGCGPSAATPVQLAPVAMQTADAVDECCSCETEAKATDTACCGEGCGTCGCS